MENKQDMREFIKKSQRNREKIIFDGYEYNYKETIKGFLHWRCNKRGCSAILKTDPNYICMNIDVIHPNHTKSIAKIRQRAMLEDIYKRCIDTNENSRDVLLKVIEKNNNGSHEEFNHKYLIDMATKKRRECLFSFDGENDIPREIQKTRDGVNFILYNGLNSDNEKMIIFGTLSNLIHLGNSSVWLIDSTFSVVPSTFYQLCTIQCVIRGDYIPLVFCLMPSKSTKTYDHFFKILSEKYMVKWPDYLIIDFELATFISFSKIFPLTNINTCLFHFGQILWKRLQTMGYIHLYKKCSKFTFHFKMILSLVFVPHNDIFIMFKKLSEFFEREETAEEIIYFFNWFGKHFIDFDSCLNNHRPVIWSVYDRIIKRIPRTTNSLEGFHRHLNNSCITNHQSISSIGKELLNIQFFSEKKINDSLRNFNTNKKLESEKEKQLFNIVSNYFQFYDVEYLKAIVFNFNFPFGDN